MAIDRWASLYGVADASAYGWEEWATSTLPSGPKCECGCSIALGAEDQPMFHSSWCPIGKAYLEEQKKIKEGTSEIKK